MKLFNWIRETYSIPTNPMWSAWFCIILAFALLLTSLDVRAQKGDLWLDMNVTSWHSNETYTWKGNTKKYNSDNIGLGLSYEVEDWYEVKVGVYDNSYYKTTVYGGVNVKHDLAASRNWTIAPGLTAGVVTGYNDTPMHAAAIAPILLPNVELGYDQWRAVVGFIPVRAFGFGNTDVITVQVSAKF